MKFLITLTILFTWSTGILLAQDSDQLFSKAREEAFERKNYPVAVQLAKQALEKSPDYTDISIFLGRLYTWMDQPDSARMVFKELEVKRTETADFYLAYASLEYWEDHYNEATRIVDKGLTQLPNDLDILTLKAKILNASKNYTEANRILKQIITIDPKHTEARKLAISIKDQVSGNEVGISYNWMHFDKQFADDWHIMGISYKRATPIGSFIFKTNYANKFASNGVQFELEAYPRLSKLFYMYIGTGYSNSTGLFPRFRTGASLYANLPASFEAEAGFRQLKFSEHIWIYTASIGKYYKNFWFNVRTYLTPDRSNISQSYAATVRYYTKGADDYLGFVIGTGISPEENRENLWAADPYQLKTFKTGLDYNLSLKNRNLLSISGTYYNVEYKAKSKDNQVDINIGYRRRF